MAIDETIYVKLDRDLIFTYLLNTANVLRNPKSKLNKTILDIYEGDQEIFTFSASMNGLPVDLTAYDNITVTIKQRESDLTPILQFDISPSDPGNDFANGIFVLALDNAATSILPLMTDFDIKAIKSGEPTTLVAGEINTKPPF